MLTHTSTEKIETARLILRKFQYSDNADMRKYWISDPEVQSLYCEPIYEKEEEVKALLDKYINSYEKEDYYRWAIELKETGECIGQIAYFLVDSKNHFGEIEYCIGSAFQKKGFATEATKSVIQYGFEKINFNKIQICHKSKNIPSKKVIENCGLTYEGVLRDFFYEDGGYVDRLYYSILKREYYKIEKKGTL